MQYEEELISDLAEYYNITNMYAYDVGLIATLAVKLREDSRVKTSMSGLKVPLNTILIAAVVDRLSLLIWQRTKDGHENRNRPAMIVESMLTKEQSDGFDSIEEFKAYRASIMHK